MSRSAQRWGVIMLAAVLTACTKPSPGTDEVAPSAQVRVITVQPTALAQHLEAYGVVGFPPELQHTLNAAVESRVAKLLVSPGESVVPGQQLLRLEPSVGSGVQLQKARADAGFAAAELARVERLRAQQLATNSELAAARQNHAHAQADLGVLEKAFGPGNGAIIASRAGVVASVDVQQGDIVAAGAALIHLADSRVLRLRLGVEPADLARMSPGQPVVISAAYDPSLRATGRVAKLVSQVDPQTHLGLALVDVDGDSALLPGSTVRASIEVARHAGVLAVPRSAVLKDRGAPYAFVVTGEKARRVPLKIGQDDGTRVEVLKGLEAGDEIVVEGNYELEDGMRVRKAAQTP